MFEQRNSPVHAKETHLRMLMVAFVCHNENNNNHESNVEWKSISQDNTIYIDFFSAKQYNMLSMYIYCKKLKHTGKDTPQLQNSS